MATSSPKKCARRRTRQKDAVAAALESAAGPLMPAELLKIARRQSPGLGIATIYRALSRMVEAGEAALVQIPDQPPRYERAQEHHHHFYCRKCRRVYELHACDGAADRLAPKGFKVDEHEITLYGVCARCGKNA